MSSLKGSSVRPIWQLVSCFAANLGIHLMVPAAFLTTFALSVLGAAVVAGLTVLLLGWPFWALTGHPILLRIGLFLCSRYLLLTAFTLLRVGLFGKREAGQRLTKYLARQAADDRDACNALVVLGFTYLVVGVLGIVAILLLLTWPLLLPLSMEIRLFIVGVWWVLWFGGKAIQLPAIEYST